MDRVNQLRGGPGSSRDSTLDTTSPSSEAFVTANESSKFFSLTEEDSTFDISPIKDLPNTTSEIDSTITDGSDQLMPNLSPISKNSTLLDSYKIDKHIDAEKILSGGVDIFEDNDNSYDGNELVIDDNVRDEDDKVLQDKVNESCEDVIQSKDTEVVLQIDGKNVDAIDIGNGLYLYRKEGQDELAAVQIADDNQQQPSFKFLKVRENAEGNLEVYEEIEIEVPKDAPPKEKVPERSHLPIKDIEKIVTDSGFNSNDSKTSTSQKEILTAKPKIDSALNKESQIESKTELNFNGKMVKYNESRKSPVTGIFTPMTYHSTPNKEGIPLTKTMVDQHLHPSRHSDNVKKTIEVHTDSIKKVLEPVPKNKDSSDECKPTEIYSKELPEEINKHKIMNKSENANITVAINDNEQSKCDDKSLNTNVDQPQKEVLISETFNKSTDHVEIKENTGTDKVGDEAAIDVNKNLSDTENKDVMNETVKSTNNMEIKEKERVTNKLVDESSQEVKSSDSLEMSSQVLRIERQEEVPTVNETKNHSLNNEVTTTEIITEINETIYDTLETKMILTEKPSSEEKTSSEKKPNSEEKPAEKLEINSNAKEIDNQTDTLINQSESKSMEIIAEKTLTTVVIKGIEEKIETKTNKDVLLKDNKNLISKKPSNNETNINQPENNKNKLLCQSQQSNYNPPDQPSRTTVKNVDNEALEHDNNGAKPCTDLNNQFNKIEPPIVLAANANENNAIPSNINKQLDIKNITLLKSNTEDNPKNIEPQASKDDKKYNIISDTICQVKKSSNLLQKISEIKNVKEEKLLNKTTDSLRVPTPSLEVQKSLNYKVESINKNINLKASLESKPKPVNINNNAAVPFGKWTEANRQEFLNKIKESKIPINSATANQIKQPNDLNRRDVLKKIDSQRQSNLASVKSQDLGSQRLNVKSESSVFNSTKAASNKESKIDLKSDLPNLETKTETPKLKPTPSNPKEEIGHISDSSGSETNPRKRKEINNQDLIDKTIEDMIHRAVTGKSLQEETKQSISLDKEDNTNNSNVASGSPINIKQTPLDAIEMKMNELHGIPFIERPVHELPQMFNHNIKTYSKSDSSKPLMDAQNLKLMMNKNLPKMAKDTTNDIDSEEEIIEHEPITGDVDLKPQSKTSTSIKNLENASTSQNLISSKKETVITEKDFDKFARRNSITYENCLTVNYDTAPQQNLVQNIKDRDIFIKKSSRNETLLSEAKSRSQMPKHYGHQHRIQTTSMIVPIKQDNFNKNYQTKLQVAYQSALTAKRKKENPITILEDKPVKVVFMDQNAEIITCQLNAQGKELSPIKKARIEPDASTISTNDSMDSDVLEAILEGRSDDLKKSKHQRKQVLTPVENPEPELIEPKDLNFEVSPKKKRKTEDGKADKSSKSFIHKKSYLLGRDHTSSIDVTNEYTNVSDVKPMTSVGQTNQVVSAIDNLVKAAELLENQSKALETSQSSLSSQESTPVKRGRGRPRKYPLWDDNTGKPKAPSPQKRPRLIDAKQSKHDTSTEEDYSSDDTMVKENWTMGKINENIVCPICNKLFRSENVVFKHVKHCTGPSPSRSDSDKRSRASQDSETKSSEEFDRPTYRRSPKIRDSKSNSPIDDVIVIEDTPTREKLHSEKESGKMVVKSKAEYKSNNLACGICGKTFRQLSYLVNHKMQHKKDDSNKSDDSQHRSIFSCEVCKKEFRKLHHLVQHRIIHNPSTTTSAKLRRKSSVEQNETPKNQTVDKQSEDLNAGFRCEPCDKSFRKLHHLVEHRETHDEISRRESEKNTSVVQTTSEKPSQPPQCEVCQKSFRKLHHLIEHKEQYHQPANTVKVDDIDVKNALSTKDIIHECPLCYMVFPNEHSLNKHSVFCQKKKKSSKQAKIISELEPGSMENESQNDDDKREVNELSVNEEENTDTDSDEPLIKVSSQANIQSIRTKENVDSKRLELQEISNKKNFTDIRLDENSDQPKLATKSSDIIEKNKNPISPPTMSEYLSKKEKSEEKEVKITPKKKKQITKEKIHPTVTKRQKSTNLSLPIVNDSTPAESDDDEIRYMHNPDYKPEVSEEKLFMHVRTNKRNSLQLERSTAQEFVKRRISLQNPPKMLAKVKVTTDAKPVPIPLAVSKLVEKPKPDLVSSSDSDDSDVKYSFPPTVEETVAKSAVIPKTKVDNKPQLKKKSTTGKRKSLSGIAKRKSLGKTIIPRPKIKPHLAKIVKRRTNEVEHRCDCGELFSSAALLSRHTTLAHTPPRIRRRRSPPPNIDTKTITKIATKKSTTPKVVSPRKIVKKSESSNLRKPSVETRKSSADTRKASVDAKKGNVDTRKASVDTRKSSVDTRKSSVEARKSGADARKASVDARKSGTDITRKASIVARKSSAEATKYSVDAKKSTAETRKSSAEARKLSADAIKSSAGTRKSSVDIKNVSGDSVKKSSTNKNEPNTVSDKRKSVKSNEKPESKVASTVKSRNQWKNIAHKGVPVPEKMRKFIEKSKK